MIINLKKYFFVYILLAVLLAVGIIFLINKINDVGFGFYREGKSIVHGPLFRTFYEGVNFGDQQVDIKSFRMLSEKYGQDKNHIYLIYFQGEDCCWAKIVPTSTIINSLK